MEGNVYTWDGSTIWRMGNEMVEGFWFEIHLHGWLENLTV